MGHPAPTNQKPWPWPLRVVGLLVYATAITLPFWLLPLLLARLGF